jgi:hypothetical protein
MAEKMNPVNWFEIPVRDLERAKKFYEGVFGLELSLNKVGPLKMAWFPMTQDAPGASGSLVQAEGYVPSQTGTLGYFTVEDIEATLNRIDEKGGKTILPKTGIGEYGFIVQLEGCEGNRVALHAFP